ncbi:MAG: hypothetical protein KatS3mg121_1082 [Gammaproteobacteria bacterium]|nr:MAG: hypothetical protein KatS3mg121_1082 [Gammaproteobacteria bacterium]
MYRTLQRIRAGRGRPEDLERLERIAGDMAGRTICALADAAAMPVQSFLAHFRDEFAYYIEHGRSRVDGAAEPA